MLTGKRNEFEFPIIFTVYSNAGYWNKSPTAPQRATIYFVRDIIPFIEVTYAND